MISDWAARGQVYAPAYVIDYGENESFWRDYFARVVRPSAQPPPGTTGFGRKKLRELTAIAHDPPE